MYIMLGCFINIKTFALAVLLVLQSSAGKNRNKKFFNMSLTRKLHYS